MRCQYNIIPTHEKMLSFYLKNSQKYEHMCLQLNNIICEYIYIIRKWSINTQMIENATNVSYHFDISLQG